MHGPWDANTDVCHLEPRIACLFFNSTCLANLNDAAIDHVEGYFADLLTSLTFWSLSVHFVNAILIFTLARFGGVPVPLATRVGTAFWGVFMAMQGLQYLIVILSILMDIFAFLALRTNMAC